MHFARGSQQMRVPVALVSAKFGLVQRYVYCAAVLAGQASCESQGQLLPLAAGELAGQGQFPLSRRAPVPSLLRSLGGIPQLGARPGARPVRQHQLRMHHAAPPRVIMRDTLPLIAQTGAGAESRGAHRAAAGAAAKRLGLAGVDGH